MAKLEWSKNPTTRVTIVARLRSWRSKCKRYRVTRSHILYGERGRIDERGRLVEKPYPDMYMAEVYDPDHKLWDIIGRHRNKRAAMKRCEDHAKIHDAIPKPKR